MSDGEMSPFDAWFWFHKKLDPHMDRPTALGAWNQATKVFARRVAEHGHKSLARKIRDDVLGPLEDE